MKGNEKMIQCKPIRGLLLAAAVLIMTMLAFCVTTQICHADTDEYTAGSSMSSEDIEESMDTMASGAWAKNSNGTYNDGNGTVLKGAVAKGIDVSKWQGDINWSKVKNSGIDYVILRCGYRSNSGTIYTDQKWTTNVAACEKYGIPYGVYFYSTAKTTSQVTAEINKVLTLLKGHSPTYPVYYDLEDPYRLQKQGKTFISNAGLNFCKTVKAAGYQSGVYASKSWWDSYLTSSSYDNYERWVAHWRNSKTNYSKSFSMWQCCGDNGNIRISGISGNVDLNFAFKDFYQTPGEWSTDESGAAIFMTYVKLDDGTYDTEQDMVKATSCFIRYGGSYYYMDSDGHKTTGFATIDDQLYYFTSGGIMKKGGWFTVDSSKYYAASSGVLYKSGNRKVGYYYYGFDDNGVMQHSTKYTFNGKCYYYFSSGKSCLSKCKAKSRTKYRSGPSTHYKKKGTLKKNKVVYVIRRSGSWSQLSNYYWVKTKYLKVTLAYPYAAPVEETTTEPTTDTTDSTTTDATTSTSESTQDTTTSTSNE